MRIIQLRDEERALRVSAESQLISFPIYLFIYSLQSSMVLSEKECHVECVLLESCMRYDLVQILFSHKNLRQAAKDIEYK